MTLAERLLAVVFDGAEDLELATDLAEDTEGQAEMVRLVAVLSELPGAGARQAEARLDNLMEIVSLAAVVEVVNVPEPERQK